MFTVGSRRQHTTSAARAPTLPAAFRAGAGTRRPGAAQPARRAVAAHLVRELADADRLLEVAGEPGRDEPVAALERQRAQRDDRDPPRCARQPARAPRRVRAVHVREPEVHQDHVRQVLGGERDPLGAGLRLERPEARRRAARRGRASGSCSLSSTIRTSGRRAAAPGAGGVTGVSSAHADPARARRGPLPRPRGRPAPARDAPDFEVVAVCGDLDSLLAAVEAERPDVVVTDIRMPPGEHGRGDPGRRAAARDEPGGRRRRAQPVREPGLRARAAGRRQRAPRLPPEGAA